MEFMSEIILFIIFHNVIINRDPAIILAYKRSEYKDKKSNNTAEEDDISSPSSPKRRRTEETETGTFRA
jgi:hypothetical protein